MGVEQEHTGVASDKGEQMNVFEKIKKLYVLEFDIYNYVGTEIIEHRIHHYSTNARQDWLSDYFARKDKPWNYTNVKAYVFGLELECDEKRMESLRDGI